MRTVLETRSPSVVNWQQCTISHYILLLAAVLCNTAEDNLLSRLLGNETKAHNLLSIPTAHHLGQPLHLDIQLALKKIVKMVRFSPPDNFRFILRVLQFHWRPKPIKLKGVQFRLRR